ncbi:MAG: TolB family protein [Anaerolineae bacterium]
MHEILARGAVRMLLQGLVDRKPPALWATQLTDRAREAYQDLLLGRFATSSPHVSRFVIGQAVLLPDGHGYAVPATLYETLADGTPVGAQEVTFTVVRQGHLWLVDELHLGPYQEATPTPVVGPSSGEAPVSPLTGTIAFADAPGGTIYLMGADGSGLRPLTHGMDPALSPDGRWVAFVRWEEPRGLYLIGVDGRGERLVYGAPQVRMPAWSPDGRQLAFAVQKGGKPERRFRFGDRVFVVPADPYWRLAWVDLETGEYQDLPSDLHSLAPVWSPDGAWLLYDGDPGLQRLSVESGKQELAVEGRTVAGPAWSPDGQWIVYQDWRHDHWELFVRPAWGGEAVPLTPASALAGRAFQSLSPAFSPDGRWILFASDRDGTWGLYLVRPDGTGLRPLVPGGLPGGLVLRYEPATQRILSWAR